VPDDEIVPERPAFEFWQYFCQRFHECDMPAIQLPTGRDWVGEGDGQRVDRAGA
jgi:hypothetical protein